MDRDEHGWNRALHIKNKGEQIMRCKCESHLLEGGNPDKIEATRDIIAEKLAVRWTLGSSADCAKDWKDKLTDEELEYCLKTESAKEQPRVTVIRMLEVEKRSRLKKRNNNGKN
jgi:predicted transcriptional regulator